LLSRDLEISKAALLREILSFWITLISIPRWAKENIADLYYSFMANDIDLLLLQYASPSKVRKGYFRNM
jgi:hypothetical protein